MDLKPDITVVEDSGIAFLHPHVHQSASTPSRLARPPNLASLNEQQ
jgi:hypothetical protein